MPFVVGENVGPYRIMEKLGRGGMATVFKCYHAALDRYVAIKALHPAFMEDPNFLARFQREARVVAKLEHPNIVPIYDFAEHEGRPYLVMKFIEGETLKARLIRRGIEQDQIRFIVKAVGDGLTYAHGRGILHRDVKPSNVLISNDDRIYLADFGLARIAQAGESTISGDMMLGTPQYISPEQAMGVGDLDEGTDIYSFGVMLYELIVGQVPFSADTPFSIIHDHIYTPLPLPRSVNPHVPEAIERILLKALAKEREDRFENISALVKAFTNAFTTAGAMLEANTPATVPETIAEKSLPAREQDIPTESIPEPQETHLTRSDAAKLKRKKPFLRRLRWWQILLIVFGIILCCLLTLGIIGTIQQRQQEDAQTAVPTTEVIEEFPAETSVAITVDDQIGIAEQLVKENPDDPDTYIDLGIAYYDAAQYQLAEDAFQQAVEISGGSLETYLKVIRNLKANELWVNAAKFYLQMFKDHPDQVGGAEMDDFHKSAYLSTTYPVALDYVPLTDVAEVDIVFEQILKARYLLFNDSAESAQDVLDQLGERGGNYPEAQLVQAEIYNVLGRTRDAAEILEVLLKSDDTPQWIVDLINEVIYTFRQAEETQESAMSVAEALTLRDADPENPWVQLDYVEALIAEGIFDQIEAEMQRALDLAGDDPAVYFRGGEILAQYNINLYAVDMFLGAANIAGDPNYEGAQDRINESVYLSSVGADAIEHLETLESELDPLGMEIARIRNTLHNDDQEVARYKYQILREEYPDIPELLLLEAEILSIFGDDQTAIEQWTALVEEESVPFWMRRQARIMLRKFDQ